MKILNNFFKRHSLYNKTINIGESILSQNHSTNSLNTLILGNAGSGKSRSYVLPNIMNSINNNDSIIVLSSDWSIFYKSKEILIDNEYNIELINLGEWHINSENEKYLSNDIELVCVQKTAIFLMTPFSWEESRYCVFLNYMSKIFEVLKKEYKMMDLQFLNVHFLLDECDFLLGEADTNGLEMVNYFNTYGVRFSFVTMTSYEIKKIDGIFQNIVYMGAHDNSTLDFIFDRMSRCSSGTKNYLMPHEIQYIPRDECLVIDIANNIWTQDKKFNITNHPMYKRYIKKYEE